MATYQSSDVSAGGNATAEQYNDLRADAITAQNIKSGLDAAKSATPAVGDVYYATDTDSFYVCKATNVWSINVIPQCSCVASDILRASADTEKSRAFGTEEAAGVYSRIKEIIISVKGSIRTKFDIKCNVNGKGYGKVYINGIAVGTERVATTSYVTHSQDFSNVDLGDRIQIYWHGSVGSTETVYIDNFRIYYNLSLGYDNTPAVSLN